MKRLSQILLDSGLKAVRCPFVDLKLEGESTLDEGAKWVEVARTGTFLGYAGGAQPFEFTRETFDRVIQNFQNHPAFERDAMGQAVGSVVAWDFHHASEMPATAGNIATAGTPAQGWTLDLKIIDAPDGVSKLMALTKFIEPAKSYVKAGQYRWASVAISFNTIDQVTGENIGPVLTSIALTNQPFIEGMDKLVAEKGAAPEAVQLRHYYFEPADSPTSAVEMLKDMFALPPTTGAAEVLAQIKMLQAMVESGTVPVGVDVASMLAGMRRILNLAALSESAEVFAEADRLISSLIEEAATEQGLPTGSGSEDSDLVPELPDGRTQLTKENEMSLKILASKLGVKESEDAVVSAVQSQIALSAGIASLLGLDPETTTPEVLLKKAQEQAGSDKDSREMLSAIFEAAEVEDPSSAVEVIAGKIADAKKLAEVMPQLDALEKAKQEAEETEIKEDVDAVLNSRFGGAENMRAMLTKSRRDDKDGFMKAFPKLDETKAHLTKTHFATPGGAQTTPGQASEGMSLVPQNDGSVKLAVNAPAKVVSGTPGTDVVNLAAFKGRNRSERALAYLSKTGGDAFAKLTRDQQFEALAEFNRRSDVIDDAGSL